MVTGLTTALSTTETTGQKDQPSGYAGLDSDGRISMDAIPQTLTDALIALVAAQQETNERLKLTNELLFETLSRSEIDSADKEIPANAS